MITEKQLSDFEEKVKQDSLKAFNDMLESYKVQSKKAIEITNNVQRFKGVLQKYADEAKYKVNWDTFTATPYANVGTCVECKKDNVGIIDYNGHGHWCCLSCWESLQNQLDNYEN